MPHPLQTCLCGCGERVKPGNQYVIGHNTRRVYRAANPLSVPLMEHLKNAVAVAAVEGRMDVAQSLNNIIQSLEKNKK